MTAKKTFDLKYIITIAALICISLLSTGCAQTNQVKKGYMFNLPLKDENVKCFKGRKCDYRKVERAIQSFIKDTIKVGITSSQDILSIFGSPTTISNSGNFIYAYREENRNPFTGNTLLLQMVLVIHFDKDNVVSKFTMHDTSSARYIKFEKYKGKRYNE